MSRQKFYLPDLGEGLKLAEIIGWQVSVGDHVVQDQPMLTVETAKAVADIPAPWSGRLLACYGRPGDQIEVGDLLVEIDTEQDIDSRAVVGQLPTIPANQPATDRPGQPHGTRISPRLRQYARDRQVDIEQLEGSGPMAAITTADIEQAAAQGASTAGARSVLRRQMARNMERANREVAHASIHDYADISRWPGHGVAALLARALVEACREQPALNAHYDGENRTLAPQVQINLGIAVDTGQGLLVPVLHDLQALPPEAIEGCIAALAETARAGLLTPGQLQGATLSLSNFGSIAGRTAQMIVLPPQVAIVGAGHLEAWPVIQGDRLEQQQRLPLSLSFDHRAVTGGEAARFIRALIQSLELLTR